MSGASGRSNRVGSTRLAAEVGKHCLSDVLVHEEVGDVVGDVGGPAGQALEDRLLAHGGSGGMGDPLDRCDPQVLGRRFDDRTERCRLDEVAIEDRELCLRVGADVYTSWTAVIASPSVVNRHTPKFDRNIIWRALRIRSSADWCRAAIVCSAENTWSGSFSCASTAASSIGRARIGVGRSASGRSSSRGSTRQRQSGGWAGLSRVVSSGRIGCAGFVVVQPAVGRQQDRAAQQLRPGGGDEVVLGPPLGQQHEVIGGPVPAEPLDADAWPAAAPAAASRCGRAPAGTRASRS